MPFDGYGNFTRDYNWEADKLADIPITAGRMDGEFDNFAAGMNQAMLRNGVAGLTGDLRMGGNKITGLSAGAAASPAIQFNTDNLTGFYLPATGVLGFTVLGTERGRFTNTGFSITGKFGCNTATPRTEADMGGGRLSLASAFEDVVIAAAALTGVVNLDHKVSSVYMNTANAAGNWTFNIRGDNATTLDSTMAIGQMLTMAIEVPQGATAYYCTAITIDGAAPAATKWNGGPPTAGYVSSINVYHIRVTKTAAGTFQVRGSLSQEK